MPNTNYIAEFQNSLVNFSSLKIFTLRLLYIHSIYSHLLTLWPESVCWNSLIYVGNMRIKVIPYHCRIRSWWTLFYLYQNHVPKIFSSLTYVTSCNSTLWSINPSLQFNHIKATAYYIDRWYVFFLMKETLSDTHQFYMRCVRTFKFNEIWPSLNSDTIFWLLYLQLTVAHKMTQTVVSEFFSILSAFQRHLFYDYLNLILLFLRGLWNSFYLSVIS